MDNHNKKQKDTKKKRDDDAGRQNSQDEIPHMNGEFKKQKEMYEDDDGAEFTTAEIIDFSQGVDS